MTFYVHFFAEQAFLSFVKEGLEDHHSIQDKYSLDTGAVSVLACTAAMEAILNQLFACDGRLRHYDSLRLAEKIETLGDFANIKVHWGEKPWQDIARLILVRNWLAHFKDTTIGLINSDSKWIGDGTNKIPKFVPHAELSFRNVNEYYEAVLLGMVRLAKGLKLKSDFDYLESRKYETIIVG